MKRYNILDWNENIVKRNLSYMDCIAWINDRDGFLLEPMSKQDIIDIALKNIVKDVMSNDLTAIEELISSCEYDALIGYLPDGEEG